MDQAAVEREQGAALVQSARDDVSVLRINVEPVGECHGLRQININQGECDLLVNRHRRARLFGGNTLALEHGGKGVADFPRKRAGSQQLDTLRARNQIRFFRLIGDDRDNYRGIYDDRHLLPPGKTSLPVDASRGRNGNGLQHAVFGVHFGEQGALFQLFAGVVFGRGFLLREFENLPLDGAGHDDHAV